MSLRKEEIIQVAVLLFEEKGYSATSVQDIADKIGFTKAALYYYFNSKEEILWEIFDKTMTTAERRLAELLKLDLPMAEKVSQIVYNQIMSVRDEAPYIAIFFTERVHLPTDKQEIIMARRQSYEKKLAATIQEGIDEGILEPFAVIPTVYGILGMCNWMYHWFNPKGSYSLEEIAEQYSKIILHGILKT